MDLEKAVSDLCNQILAFPYHRNTVPNNAVIILRRIVRALIDEYEEEKAQAVRAEMLKVAAFELQRRGLRQLETDWTCVSCGKNFAKGQLVSVNKTNTNALCTCGQELF